MIIKTLTAACVLLALTACDAKPRRQTVDLSGLTYERDSLGLCYAVIGHVRGSYIGAGSQGFTMTWVPCSPEVLAHLAKY